MKDGRKYARDVLHDRFEDWKTKEEDLQVATRAESGLHCFGPEDKILCHVSPWMSSGADGWRTVECILDSGASESVCPASMAPLWPVEDSPGSLVGLHYLSASGGRLKNCGQQHVPIELTSGQRTHALFQIAEVSRPLVSVARLTEAGKAVIFGCSGGVIRDLQSGVDTPFERRDGIYIFQIRIPPPDAVAASAGFGRQA